MAWHGVRLFLFLSEGVKEELNVEPDLDTQPFFLSVEMLQIYFIYLKFCFLIRSDVALSSRRLSRSLLIWNHAHTACVSLTRSVMVTLF